MAIVLQRGARVPDQFIQIDQESERDEAHKMHPGLPIYSRSELHLLANTNFDAETIRLIHEIKTRFDGVLSEESADDSNYQMYQKTGFKDHP